MRIIKNDLKCIDWASALPPPQEAIDEPRQDRLLADDAISPARRVPELRASLQPDSSRFPKFCRETPVTTHGEKADGTTMTKLDLHGLPPLIPVRRTSDSKVFDIIPPRDYQEMLGYHTCLASVCQVGEGSHI